MTIDITRAICRPTNRSRMIVVTMIRPTDPPIPCRKRAASSCEKLCVVTATIVASTKSVRPIKSDRRRPKRSASGPQTSCPIAIPSMNTVTTSGRLLASCTPSVAPISGSAGSMMSIDIAVIDISSAISARNSRNGSGKRVPVSFGRLGVGLVQGRLRAEEPRGERLPLQRAGNPMRAVRDIARGRAPRCDKSIRRVVSSTPTRAVLRHGRPAMAIGGCIE